jgi:ABC-type transporter Mla MlaB component
MLRVTATKTPKAATLKLEGKLSGPWVDELRQCWTNLVKENIPVRIDLRELSFLDLNGRTLLLRMERQGTQLLEGSAFIRGLLYPETFQQSTSQHKTSKES